MVYIWLKRAYLVILLYFGLFCYGIGKYQNVVCLLLLCFADGLIW